MNGYGAQPPYSAAPRITRQPAYWLFLMLLAGSVLFVGLEQLAYVGLFPGAWLLSLVLLAAVAIPAGVIIYRLDQFEPEPATMIAIAVLWGGVVALTFAAITNSAMLGFLQHVLSASTTNSWGAAIVAPIDEELYKGLGLFLLYLIARSEFDGVMDGLVYGAMIGLGFQVVENVQYFMLAASQSNAGTIGPVVGTFFVRVVISGLYSHTLFTGLTGFGFAYFVTQRDRTFARRLGVAALFAFLAWAAHFVWNSPLLDSLMGQSAASFILVVIIKGVPFLAFLVLLWIFARRRERAAFERLMKGEVGSDVVTPEEFAILESAHRRRVTVRRVRRTRGTAAAVLTKRLMREQMNLAQFHGKVESAEHPALDLQRERIRHLKAQLAAIH